MDAVVDAARGTLVGAGSGRPVGRFQTETALEQLPGVIDLIDEALATAAEASATDPAVAAVRDRLDDAAADGQGRPDAPSRRTCATWSCPEARATAGWAPSCSPARCATRCARTTLTPERILDGGRARVHGRPRRDGPAGPRPVAGLAPGRAAARPTTPRSSAASSTPSRREHREADDLLDFCREENARIEAFCAERDLIGLADEPIDIRWTPVFLRAFGGAMLIAPGPLDKGLTTFFAITPDARRLDARSNASRTCARTTTGCSGC